MSLRYYLHNSDAEINMRFRQNDAGFGCARTFGIGMNGGPLSVALGG